ncbi:NAD(P)H-dependent oxidoreductase [Acrocarpospora macrocephala]|uniref:FMN reductase n=1 Tax=Acrocarpospora macrocephala TaxID=150177 RepID=A0A5M3WFN1_9ACTN|nr:NAD(P)H-dependent oxidoreductase [Acrocarpospora macrocephala]GES07080.1 FMN reductase [Acrocarpospora macrocephala]
MNTVVLVGNPKPASRTLAAARLVAQLLTGSPPDAVVDVVGLGAELLRPGGPAVAAAIRTVRAATLAVVASPTYKASYTGLLKLFLDQLPPDGLRGVAAVPMMLGAGPDHALAPELLLKPVLVELGATCPTRGLYVLDHRYDDPLAIEPWLGPARDQLLRLLEPGRGPAPGTALPTDTEVKS